MTSSRVDERVSQRVQPNICGRGDRGRLGTRSELDGHCQSIDDDSERTMLGIVDGGVVVVVVLHSVDCDCAI